MARPPTPARVAALGICPFKGLASFEPVDLRTTSSGVSGSSPSWLPGSSAPASSASLAHRVAGSRRSCGPACSRRLPEACSRAVRAGERLLMRPGERPMEELRRVLVSAAQDPLAEALDALPRTPGCSSLSTSSRSSSRRVARAERTAFAESLAGAASGPERARRRRGRVARGTSRPLRHVPGAGRSPRCQPGPGSHRCRPRSYGARSNCLPAEWG